MAIFNIEFFAEALKRYIHCKVILPNDRVNKKHENNKKTDKTLMLLHGYTGLASDWIWNSSIVALAEKYNICVILPEGENSFYLDGKATGRRYGTYVGEELLGYIQNTFGLSKDRKDNFIAGLSMGGFGAIHTGLQFAQNYSKIVALSSALIMYELEALKPEMDNGMANYEYYELMFGNLELLKESENNPEVLINKMLSEGKPIPDIYMACGKQDFLLEPNRMFASFLLKQGVSRVYLESEGEHNFIFWNQYLEPSIKWLLGKEQ